MPTYSEWVNAHLCTFHREPYIQERDKRRCHIEDCFRAGASITLFGTVTKRCRNHTEQALMEIHAGLPTKPVMPDPAVNLVGGNDKRSTFLTGGGDGDQPRGSSLSSRMTIHASVESGVSKPSSMSDACIRIDKLHEDNRSTVNLGPSCWHSDPTSLPDEPEAAKRPSLPSGGGPNI